MAAIEPEITGIVTGPERRYMIAYITPEILAELLSFNGVVRIEGKAPRQARLVGAHLDGDKRAFAIILEHPSFTPVKEGYKIPTLDDPVSIYTVRSKWEEGSSHG